MQWLCAACQASEIFHALNSGKSDYSRIPAATLIALNRWSFEGVPPGDFVMAVLCNNLEQATGRADYLNAPVLCEIVNYVYNHVPSAAWGSPEKVQAWAKRFEERENDES